MRIGIDLGGTKIEAVALADDDHILIRRRVATPRHDYAAICATIVSLVAELEAELGVRGSVGVAIPGAVTPATGLVKNANTVCLIGRPLIRDLAGALGRPVRAENDANCLVVSEAADGAAAGASSVFGVIVGTGTGGALFVNGGLVAGANGIAGEWGHNPVPWAVAGNRSRSCYCGRYDCIETWLSGPGLTRSYNELSAKAAANVEAIVAAAALGESAALAALRAYAQQFARALATVVNVFDPQMIVIAGGVSNLPGLCANVQRLLPAYVFSDVLATRVVKAAHGDSSGVRGAAWLWRQHEWPPAAR